MCVDGKSLQQHNGLKWTKWKQNGKWPTKWNECGWTNNGSRWTGQYNWTEWTRGGGVIIENDIEKRERLLKIEEEKAINFKPIKVNRRSSIGSTLSNRRSIGQVDIAPVETYKLTESDKEKVEKIASKAREGSSIDTDSIIIDGIPRKINEEKIVEYIYNVLEAIGVTSPQGDKEINEYKQFIQELYETGDLEIASRAYTRTIFIRTPTTQHTGPQFRKIETEPTKYIDNNKYFLHQTLALFVNPDGTKQDVYNKEIKPTRLYYQLLPESLLVTGDKLRSNHLVYVIRGTCFGTTQSTEIRYW